MTKRFLLLLVIVLLSNQIKTINLDIQKFYSDNKFTYTFDVNKNLETSEYYIPSMILQPFIENSIEHGFRNISAGGLIIVKTYIEKNEIIISIEDNGSGFQENEKHKSYPSRATQIIKDRLFLLNKKHKANASYMIKSNSNNTGTQVFINLPIITQK